MMLLDKSVERGGHKLLLNNLAEISVDDFEDELCELWQSARQHALTFEDNLDPFQHVSVISWSIAYIFLADMDPHLQIPSVMLF